MKKSLSTIIVIIGFLTPFVAHADISTGLVGWWALDEGTGSTAYDSSGQGNNGTVENGASYTTGNIGPYAISVAGGTQKVDMGQVTSQISAATNATLCAWLNRSSASNVLSVGTGDSTSSRFNIQAFTDGKVYFTYGDTGATEYSYIANTQLGWHFFCQAFIGGVSDQVYVDGLPVSSTVNAGISPNLDTASDMGHFYAGYDTVVGSGTGSVDDVRLYDRTLSATDIAQLYAFRGAVFTSSGTWTVPSGYSSFKVEAYGAGGGGGTYATGGAGGGGGSTAFGSSVIATAGGGGGSNSGCNGGSGKTSAGGDGSGGAGGDGDCAGGGGGGGGGGAYTSSNILASSLGSTVSIVIGGGGGGGVSNTGGTAGSGYFNGGTGGSLYAGGSGAGSTGNGVSGGSSSQVGPAGGTGASVGSTVVVGSAGSGGTGSGGTDGGGAAGGPQGGVGGIASTNAIFPGGGGGGGSATVGGNGGQGEVIITYMPITQIQIAETACNSNANPCTVTISPTRAGDLIVVYSHTRDDSNEGVPGVSDSASQTYSTAYTSFQTFHYTESVSYVANTVSGVTSVTVTPHAAASPGTVVLVAEYAGIATSNPVDATNTVPATLTSPWSSGSSNTSNGEDLLIGGDLNNSGQSETITGTNGFTNLQQANDGYSGGTVAMLSQVVSSTGSYAITGTASASNNYSSFVAFKEGLPSSVSGVPGVRLESTQSNGCAISSLNCGLIGYWTFNNQDMNWTSVTGATAFDKSGNGNIGTLNNMSRSTSPVAGKLGQALSFNGVNQYVNLGNVSAYNFSGTAPFTLSAWVKFNSVSGVQTVVSKYNSNVPANQYILGLNTSPTYPALQCERETFPYNAFGNTHLVANTWYHLVCTYDGTNLSAYVNGELDATPVALGSIASQPTPVQIGEDNATLFPVNGTIDDVRIYNRALSANEVKQLYLTGQATIQATQSNGCGISSLNCGLVGYWTFNNQDMNWTSATAGTVFDKSGNGNTGTLNNMSRSTSPVAGKLGQALSFNGSDSVDMGTIASLTGASNASLCGWINRSSASNILAFGPYITNGRFNILALSNGNMYLQVENGSANSPNMSYGLTGWHYICMTFDGTQGTAANRVKGYIDGVSQTLSQDGTGNPATLENSDFQVGQDSAWGFSTGDVDDVRLYNKTLSASEIKQLYMIGGGWSLGH